VDDGKDVNENSIVVENWREFLNEYISNRDK